MPAPHYILSATNTELVVTNFRGTGTVNSLDSAPLGTVGGTATGELALKVLSLGGTAPTGVATAANQATQITAEQAILAKLPGSTARTFALASTISGSGTIMSGANSGSIILSADFVGSIAGKAIDMTVTGASAVPFAGIDIPLNGNDTLVAVAYTRSAGTIWYTTIT